MPQTNEQATRADLQAKVEELAGLLIDLLDVTDPTEPTYSYCISVEMVKKRIKVLRAALEKLQP